MKMARKISLSALVILLLSSSGVFAQYKSVELGVKIAPNMGWMRTDAENYNSTGVVPGISWGLISDFYFAENYAIGTGFSVSFQNGKLSYLDLQDYNIGTLNRKYRLKYVDVPLTIKMKTNDINNYRFFGQFGFQPGVRIGAKAKDSFRVETPGFTTNRDWHTIEGQVNLFRIAMIVGVGIEYPIDHSTSIVAGISFINGLTDVLKGKNAIDKTVDHKGIPNALELTLGVVF